MQMKLHYFRFGFRVEIFDKILTKEICILYIHCIYDHIDYNLSALLSFPGYEKNYTIRKMIDLLQNQRNTKLRPDAK